MLQHYHSATTSTAPLQPSVFNKTDNHNCSKFKNYNTFTDSNTNTYTAAAQEPSSTSHHDNEEYYYQSSSSSTITLNDHHYHSKEDYERLPFKRIYPMKYDMHYMSKFALTVEDPDHLCIECALIILEEENENEGFRSASTAADSNLLSNVSSPEEGEEEGKQYEEEEDSKRDPQQQQQYAINKMSSIHERLCCAAYRQMVLRYPLFAAIPNRDLTEFHAVKHIDMDNHIRHIVLGGGGKGGSNNSSTASAVNYSTYDSTIHGAMKQMKAMFEEGCPSSTEQQQQQQQIQCSSCMKSNAEAHMHLGSSNSLDYNNNCSCYYGHSNNNAAEFKQWLTHLINAPIVAYNNDHNTTCPLWEIVVFHNYKPGNEDEDKSVAAATAATEAGSKSPTKVVPLLFRIHHSLGDGTTLAELFKNLCDDPPLPKRNPQYDMAGGVSTEGGEQLQQRQQQNRHHTNAHHNTTTTSLHGIHATDSSASLSASTEQVIHEIRDTMVHEVYKNTTRVLKFGFEYVYYFIMYTVTAIYTLFDAFILNATRKKANNNKKPNLVKATVTGNNNNNNNNSNSNNSNYNSTHHRSIAWINGTEFSMQDAKNLSKRFNFTINDIVMSCVATGIARYNKEQEEEEAELSQQQQQQHKPAHVPVRFSLPVNIRRDPMKVNVAEPNEIGFMTCAIAPTLNDNTQHSALSRLKQVKRIMDWNKRLALPYLSNNMVKWLFTDAAQLLMSSVTAATATVGTIQGSRSGAHTTTASSNSINPVVEFIRGIFAYCCSYCSVAFTNVRSSQDCDLHMLLDHKGAGYRVKYMMGFNPTPLGVPFTSLMMSYNGKISISIVANNNSSSDAATRILQYIVEEWQQLQHFASS